MLCSPKAEHQRHYHNNPFFHASVDHLIYQLLPALLDGLATSTAEQYDEHQKRIRLLEASPTGVFIPHIRHRPSVMRPIYDPKVRRGVSPPHRPSVMRPTYDLKVRRGVSPPRRFVLVRDEDETGISGTGVVAFGVCFADGVAVTRWNSDVAQTCVWASIDELEAVHGHGGKTLVVWFDPELAA